MVVSMAILSILDVDKPVWVMALGLAVLGLVWGLSGGPVGARLIDNVPEEDRGFGSAILSFFIYFGSALGTALFAGLFGFGSSSQGTPIAELDPAVFMDGFAFTMAVGVVLAVLCLVSAAVVNERKAVK